jgi:hypothetical protein
MTTKMKTLSLALGLVALSATIAAAEPAPPDHYVIAGAQGMVQRQFEAGGTLEGGQRLWASPTAHHASFDVLGHAMLAAGHSVNGGAYQQVRAGAEGRGCVFGTIACAIVGLDLGYQHDHAIEDGSSGKYEPYDITAHDGLAVTRFGLEAGTRHVRVRTMLEVTYRTRLNHEDMSEDASGFGGLALGAGLGYAF